MSTGPAVLRGGFRPFFLGAGVWAIVALALWLATLFSIAPADLHRDPLAWHRHEMVFGFAGAAIAGFVLTAVPNWTGRLPIAGLPLGLLFGAWAAARALPFLAPAGSALPAVAGGGFFLALAGLLAREVAQGSRRNLPVVGAVALFGIAAGADSLAMAGWWSGDTGWRGGIALATMLIALIGGRIVPSFTRNWLSARKAKGPLPDQPTRFDGAVLALTGAALLVWLVLPQTPLGAALLLGACAGNFVRLSRWQGWRCWWNPLLTVLHVGYAWLVVGLGLLGAAQVHVVSGSAAIHALGAGAAGTMILAVMSRASLGHTGRPLVAGPVTTAAYLLVFMGALARVLAALGLGEMQAMLALSGAAWLAGWSLFLWRYWPVLTSPRLEKE